MVPLTIVNDGDGPLELTLRRTLIHAPALRPGAKSSAHDRFGHTWIDSDTPGASAFVWKDIRAHGSALALTSPESSVQVPLPFAFAFYGVTHHAAIVGRNGWISFAPALLPTDPVRLPSPEVTGAMLAPLWTAFDPDRGEVHVESTDHGFIVQYTDMVPLDGEGACTFQVVLRPVGHLEIRYLQASTPVQGWSVGMQNAAGDDGVSVAFDVNGYLHDRLSVQVGEPTPWFDVSATHLEVSPQSSQSLEVTFDYDDLAPGVHAGAIVVESNDPNQPVVVVGVDAAIAAGRLEPARPPRAHLKSIGPNPFRGRTRIVVDLPRAGAVDLSVYDVRGRRVRQLIGHTLAAGTHTAEWSGRDEQGARRGRRNLLREADDRSPGAGEAGVADPLARGHFGPWRRPAPRATVDRHHERTGNQIDRLE